MKNIKVNGWTIKRSKIVAHCFKELLYSGDTTAVIKVYLKNNEHPLEIRLNGDLRINKQVYWQFEQELDKEIK